MMVHEVFSVLKQARIDELKDAKLEDGHAFEESQFEVAQSAAQRGATVGAIPEQVETLTLQWEESDGGVDLTSDVEDPDHLLREALQANHPKETNFVMPILQALQELGGKGMANQVIDHIEMILDPKIKNGDSGSNGWRVAVQTASAALVKKGYISAESPEGEWKLTTKGRLFFWSANDATWTNKKCRRHHQNAGDLRCYGQLILTAVE